MGSRVDEASSELARHWLRVLCDHLYALADSLEAAAALPMIEQAYEEIDPPWRQAHEMAYRLAYIWDYETSEPLLGPEERISYLEESEDEEVRALVSLISSSCLDLAQHIDFTLTGLRAEYRAEAGARTIFMARELADIPLGDRRDQERIAPEIAVFGAEGIETWTA